MLPVQQYETSNSSVDKIGERYLLNHAIVVQAACQAVVYGTMCLQAACLQAACLRNTPRLTSQYYFVFI